MDNTQKILVTAKHNVAYNNEEKTINSEPFEMYLYEYKESFLNDVTPVNDLPENETVESDKALTIKGKRRGRKLKETTAIEGEPANTTDTKESVDAIVSTNEVQSGAIEGK